MDKSLRFIKKRIKSNACLDMDNNFITLKEYNFIKAFNIITSNKANKELKIKDISNISNTITSKIKLNFKYNPNADFQYFTTESCINDGTFMFYFYLMGKILYKLFNGETIYNPLNDEIEKYNGKNIKILYEIGNFVLGDEYDKNFGTKEKPWMNSRFTVMLPIKCSIIKKE
jgi:hypothetical protein